MQSRIKVWTSLGLAATLACSGLAGCAEKTDPPPEGVTQTGEGGHDIGALPLPQRLVFMSGHVEAGLALYRAGEADAAAPHLLHPVSETHEAERAGLADLGFDATPFEAVSAALEAGEPASEIEPQLEAAEANLREVRSRAAGDTASLIRFLMETATEEYTIAVNDGLVTDPGEYQDAWGFAVVAKELAANLDAPHADDVRSEIDALLGLWPDAAPITPEQPTPVGEISAAAARVILALPSRES